MANRTLVRSTAVPAALLALLPAAAGATTGLTPSYSIPAHQQAPPVVAAPDSAVNFAPAPSIVPTLPHPPRNPAARPAQGPAAAQPPDAPAAPDASAALPPAPPPRPGLRVLPTGGIKMETAALLVSGQEGGPVPLAAVAYPLPGEAGRSRVAVVVEIEGAALVAKQSEGLLRAEVALYALDAQGALAGSAERTIEVDLAQLGGEVRDGGLKVLTELSLPPGSVSLRILVRNVATGDTGLRVLPLVVPPFSGPALVAPLLLAPREPWLVVAAGTAGRPAPLAALLPGTPGIAGEAGELPSALPILSPGHEAKAEVPVFQMPAAADLHLDVLGSAGRVADLPARILSRRPTAVPGLEVLSVAFTPQGVPEGRYALRARAGEAAGGAGQFLLLPDGGGGRAWAELTAISRARANGEAAPAADKAAAARVKARRRKPETAALLAAYQQALGRLTGGDAVGASAAIADLEVKALTGEEMLTELELRELELDVLHAWAAGGGERLAQILTVYELIYRDAWNRQRFLTAGHAGEMVVHLVDIYIKGGAADARRVGAELLVALTPRATGAGLPDLVQRALRRALDLDRDDEAALLCLAVDAERRGHYADAVRWLERLAKAHPENREARLRLALNEEKQGHRGEAERRLRDLTQDRAAAADWIAAIAWQELARAEIADRRLDAAERTVAAGLARLPGDEKLEIERAYLLDLRGQPGRAEETLGADRAPAPATSGSSARLRYDELPQELLARTWEEVRQGLAARVPSLAALLSAPERSAEVLP